MANNFYKIIPHYLAPKHLLTRFAGFVADVKKPKIKNYLIKNFIEQYGVDMSEAVEENYANYNCFNDFFIRKLKSANRPLDVNAIVSPVDGIISESGAIDNGRLIQAKGRYYSAEQLLTDATLANQFLHGSFATFYLSPKDYHRIHMPIDGEITKMIYVPGKLFSVQPTTVRTIPYLFARNERLVIFCKTELGLMSIVLVGATIVGAIGTSWQGELKRTKQKQFFDYQDAPILLRKGEELGYFKLGSTVVLLFDETFDLRWQSFIHPTSIRYGQAIAKVKKSI